MGDEKDHVDKVFTLLEKTISKSEELKDRLSKFELKVYLSMAVLSICILILGTSNPTVKAIIGIFIK